MKSLGVIETRGLTSAIQAADAACKAASVEIVGYRKIGSGLVSVCFQGEISAVRTAVDHGIEVLANSQLLVGSLVIARPEESVISKLLTVKSKKGELEKSLQPEVKAEKLVEKAVVEAKTEAPVVEVKTDINVKDIKNDPRKGKKIMMNEQLMGKILERLSAYTPAQGSVSNIAIPVGISNRHVHLSQQDVEALFGQGYQLTPFKDLKQPGQFAAKECVMVVGPKGSISKVRVLGPVRPKTQLEVSKADCFALGIKAPVRESGDMAGSGNALLIGPAGHVNLESQVICAQRHIHMSVMDSRALNVVNGQKVNIRTEGERSLVFDEVVVRVDERFSLEFHIDTDEANAAGLRNNDSVFIAG